MILINVCIEHTNKAFTSFFSFFCKNVQYLFHCKQNCWGNPNINNLVIKFYFGKMMISLYTDEFSKMVFARTNWIFSTNKNFMKKVYFLKVQHNDVIEILSSPLLPYVIGNLHCICENSSNNWGDTKKSKYFCIGFPS